MVCALETWGINVKRYRWLVGCGDERQKRLLGYQAIDGWGKKLGEVDFNVVMGCKKTCVYERTSFRVSGGCCGSEGQS